MEIYAFNEEIELQGIIEIFDSIRWRRRFFQPGEFELHLKVDLQTMPFLEPGMILHRRDAKESGIVESVEIEEMNVTVRGRFLSSLFERRIVWTKTQIHAAAEMAMRTLVSNSRLFPKMVLGEIQNFEESVDFQVTYKNLLNTLTKIAMVTGIGYRVRLDPVKKCYIFECYKGRDCSVNQSTNPKAVFSEDYENIYNVRYSKSDENHRTVALVGGQGEDENRILVTVGDAEGFSRREIFVDASDIEQGTMSMSEYEILLRQRGLEVLSSQCVSEFIESDVDVMSSLRYKSDFDLGDIVTCFVKKWNKRVDIRITEIEEIYENGIVKIIPTFGSALPELKDLLNDD